MLPYLTLGNCSPLDVNSLELPQQLSKRCIDIQIYPIVYAFNSEFNLVFRPFFWKHYSSFFLFSKPLLVIPTYIVQPTISQVTPLIFILKKVQNLVSSCFVKDKRVTIGWRIGRTALLGQTKQSRNFENQNHTRATGVDNDYCVVIFPSSSKITLYTNLRLTVCFLRDRLPDIVER